MPECETWTAPWRTATREPLIPELTENTVPVTATRQSGVFTYRWPEVRLAAWTMTFPPSSATVMSRPREPTSRAVRSLMSTMEPSERRRTACDAPFVRSRSPSLQCLAGGQRAVAGGRNQIGWSHRSIALQRARRAGPASMPCKRTLRSLRERRKKPVPSAVSGDDGRWRGGCPASTNPAWRPARPGGNNAGRRRNRSNEP